MGKRTSGAYEKESRCWPGYEPVPSKREHEEGSCRKKPASRNGGEEVDRETARRKAEEAARTDEEKAAIKKKSSSPRVRAEGRALQANATRSREHKNRARAA